MVEEEKKLNRSQRRAAKRKPKGGSPGMKTEFTRRFV